MKILGDEIKLYFADSEREVSYRFLDYRELTVDGDSRRYLFVTEPDAPDEILVFRVADSGVEPVAEDELRAVQQVLYGKVD